MKRIVTIVILVLSCGMMSAQSAFPAMGGDITNGNGSLSYTIGQVETTHAKGRVTNAETTSTSLNEGVQQTYSKRDLLINSIDGIETIIFPNPTVDNINIQIVSPQGQYYLCLYTLDGKQLIQDLLFEETTVINMESYPSGSYILRLYSDNKESKYRIIKL